VWVLWARAGAAPARAIAPHLPRSLHHTRTITHSHTLAHTTTHRAGRLDLAIEAYTFSIALDATSPAAYGNRALAYSKLQQWRAAIQDCDSVLALAAAARAAQQQQQQQRQQQQAAADGGGAAGSAGRADGTPGARNRVCQCSRGLADAG
jgi:tetratricopeptide (TPR) repeat protein